MKAMKMNTKYKNENKGFAIPIAMIAIVLLLIVGTSLLGMGLNARVYAIRTVSDISAQNAADAGLTKAIFELKQKLEGKSWLGSEMPSESNIQLTNCEAEFEYTTTLLPDGSYSIESTGISGINSRTVKCILQKKGGIDTAIFADGFITIKNSGKVGTYNGTASSSFIVGTNSTEDGTVTLYNSAKIEGGVAVGAGANPDDVINLKNSAKIEGDITAMSQDNELITPEVPGWLESYPENDTITKNITISESAKYSGINLKNSNKITITDDVSLYITGDLILGNSSEILIEDGASLTLYLDGDLIGKNSSKINNETEVPKNLQIYGLDGCTEFDLRNSTNCYAVIYAPEADFVLHNSVTIYGAIACKTFEIKNSGKIMYDVSLENEDFEPISSELTVTKWNESFD